MTPNIVTFDYPFVLLFLLIFIPIIIFELIRNKKKTLSMQLEKKLRASSFLFNLFLAFSIIALSCPRWGQGYSSSEYRKGLDIVFAIDVSRSMDLRDGMNEKDISRLERGLSIAKEIISSVTSTHAAISARFAIAVGRGRGYLSVPLTYDIEAAAIFLESLNISSVTGRSTNLESLIDAAANAFQNTSAARKIIILISDGESHAGVLRNALNRCLKEGITIITVAAGSDEGREIENKDSEIAISRRDSSVMQTIAEKTGGIYIDANNKEASSQLTVSLKETRFSDQLLSSSLTTNAKNEVSRVQETENTSNIQNTGSRETKQRRTLFIILALFSFASSKFVTRILKKHSKQLPQIMIVFLFSLFFSSCTEGKLLLLEANYLNSRGRYEEAITPYQKALNHEDAAPYAEYGLGLALYSLDAGNDAKIHYGNSQKILGQESNNEHRELRFRNHYNLGVILFEEGEFQSAAEAFKEALRADPRKADAKLNLELSLMSISMETNSKNNRTDNQEEQREILYEYLRQEEEQKWKSREWSPEEDYTGPDY
ncbi:MAG: VWA domain-containing protein [Treponema sp.]|nr:VWA domain-containing protein [Treponema sp.]MCL2251096.1 VWA domain-containing protein [Treponema sp.]